MSCHFGWQTGYVFVKGIRGESLTTVTSAGVRAEYGKYCHIKEKNSLTRGSELDETVSCYGGSALGLIMITQKNQKNVWSTGSVGAAKKGRRKGLSSRGLARIKSYFPALNVVSWFYFSSDP